ncbi:MAG: nucleotidyltransferase [Ilumatobacteraceae bacterium]|nr:nucleotidyltransferase [Ilumatobacteraceae bacterium]
MSPTLVVLAAGMGSRYGGLKQIDPMGPSGETILDYSVYDALRAGFGRVVFIIRPDFEDAFRTGVAARFADRIDVDFAFQTLDRLPSGFVVPDGREKPWGTTHAILCAREQIRDNFAVINADDFYGRDSYGVLATHLNRAASSSTDFAMVGFTLRNTLSDHGSVARGVCAASAEGFLTAIDEMTKIERDGSAAKNTRDDGTIVRLSGDEPVSMNMWGFTPRLFDHLDRVFREFLEASGGESKSECFIPLTVGQLVNEGVATCRVLRTDSSWFGVTYREDKEVVQASIAGLIERGDYPRSLWS